MPGWHLRPWRRGDEPALVRHANNPKVAAFLRDSFPHPYTPQDARTWVDHCQQQDPPREYAITAPEGAVGSVGLIAFEDIHRCGAEIGYWLGEAYWGRGIATAALVVLSEWAFSRLGLARLQAGVIEGNTASTRVLEKAGYTLEARLKRAVIKRGEIRDLLLYARVRE